MRFLPLLGVGAGVVFPLAARAATLKVGPGETYADLNAVVGVVAPGDVVLVDGNHTYPAVHFTTSGTASAPITIRGVVVSGKRPIISGGANTIEAQGDHYVFENLDITGGTSRCFYHHADDITLRFSVVHDCPAQGILGADNDSGSMLMEFDEVHHAGNGTFDHQIYMATDETTHPGSVFRMQYCYVHDGNGGNNVKSRAERNEIYSNWIEGAFYHELELIGPDPAGGTPEDLKREDSDVVGNVLFKRGTFWVVRFGGDGTGQSNGRYRFVNNTVVLQAGGSGVFRLFDGIDSLEAHNNVLFSVDGSAVNVVRDSEAVWVSGSETISGTNNWITTGATNVPTAFTGTIEGASPSLVSLTAPDLHPTATSPLVDEGGPATASPPGHPFPSPLPLPLFEPPMMTVGTTATPRPVVGTIDLGAYEFGVAPDAGPSDAIVSDAASDTNPLDSSAKDASSGDASASDSSSHADGATNGDAATSDGGSNADDGGDSGGCGCRTSAPSSSRAAWSALIVALVFARRRRATAASAR